MASPDIIQAIRAMHNPDRIADPMIYEVWYDGEITLTKAGSLYGQRGLHCTDPGMQRGLPTRALFTDHPWNQDYSRIVVGSYDKAADARALIKAYVEAVDAETQAAMKDWFPNEEV